MARKTKNRKAALVLAAAFLLAAVAFVWRIIFPKRNEGDETSMLDDLQNTLTIYNPFMSAKKTAEAIIKKWEGLYLKAYQDSAGIWTIGWGTIKYKNGASVKKGDVITKDQAQAEFEYEFNQKYDFVVSRSKVKLTDSQTAALVSFAYNVGTGALLESTLWKRIQAGESAKAVADEFLKWNKVTINGAKVAIAGLTNRRTDERALFLV
ncbi:lysozyme [Sediminibacterium ginsengisoli]|uniref:Lysozyme n=1 Tax=Sediminibacterium ginsengisoli TaxID=413434 RepID=A0A1T4RY15_9BACT|nr:lysozyme [Sediminibacterium ginsengisoli]SKA20842.1 Phage-related lysozyme (muramidase), GH24 family [Sediminibacterium ginsengisoli]